MLSCVRIGLECVLFVCYVCGFTGVVAVVCWCVCVIVSFLVLCNCSCTMFVCLIVCVCVVIDGVAMTDTPVGVLGCGVFHFGPIVCVCVVNYGFGLLSCVL